MALMSVWFVYCAYVFAWMATAGNKTPEYKANRMATSHLYSRLFTGTSVGSIIAFVVCWAGSRQSKSHAATEERKKTE